MNFLCLFVLVSLPYGYAQGFFSKLANRGKKDTREDNDDYVDVCETIKVMPRIAMAVVGGAALKAEFSAPYIAAIGGRTSNGSVSWFCGGSLISANDILTAAHCLISRNVSTIRLGSFSTKTRSTENDYEISETIIHPQYKITQSYNDIAIIKVKDKISFSRNIKPVCLPQDDSETFVKERARVVGWGAEEFGGEGSHKLQQVEVEVFSNSNCEKAYRNSTIAPKTFPDGIRKEQLCAGSSKGGKDACQGDSGGPLVLTDENGIVRQIGIVSTGAGCGFKEYPGVYTRVSSYRNWIQAQINKPSSSSSRKNLNQSSREQNSNKNNGNNQSSAKKETNTKQPPSSTNQFSNNQKNSKLIDNNGSNNSHYRENQNLREGSHNSQGSSNNLRPNQKSSGSTNREIDAVNKPRDSRNPSLNDHKLSGHQVQTSSSNLDRKHSQQGQGNYAQMTGEVSRNNNERFGHSSTGHENPQSVHSFSGSNTRHESSNLEKPTRGYGTSRERVSSAGISQKDHLQSY